jgi:hypothetical protein
MPEGAHQLGEALARVPLIASWADEAVQERCQLAGLDEEAVGAIDVVVVERLRRSTIYVLGHGGYGDLGTTCDVTWAPPLMRRYSAAARRGLRTLTAPCGPSSAARSIALAPSHSGW